MMSGALVLRLAIEKSIDVLMACFMLACNSSMFYGRIDDGEI